MSTFGKTCKNFFTTECFYIMLLNMSLADGESGWIH